MIPDSALVPTPAAGVYLSTVGFESVVTAIAAGLTSLAGDGPQLHAPPIIARETIEQVGYPETFPHLLGRVYAGPDPAESDVVLLPAACYGVYPLYAGERLTGPVEVGVTATCFRQEADHEVGRLRSFRMREFVRLDTADALAWRDDRLAVSEKWLAALGLAVVREVASDPFFGRAQRMMRMLQLDRQLKIELRVPVGPDQLQAVASGNYHTDKFGQLYGIVGPDGEITHSACLAFGYERLALALMHRHGPDIDRWPDQVQRTLGSGPA
jgi:seryl-tRNA synthetase